MQKIFAWGLTAVLVVVHAGVAQTGTTSHFEVASVKLNKVRGGYFQPCTGGPGEGSLWICPDATIDSLIQSAFNLDLYQYPGNSNYFGAVVDFYTVQARLPDGSTKEQFREMQRNLLIERFGLTWHWKESDATVYRLIRDPGGARLRESAPDAPPAAVIYGRPPAGTTTGSDRWPVLPQGVPALIGGGKYKRWRSSNVTTEDIVSVLRWEFRTDVRDETGLTGHYDVDLKWETPPTEVSPATPPFRGPDAKTEFGNRLGLRIESTKGKIKTFVVDHVEKVPSEN